MSMSVCSTDCNCGSLAAGIVVRFYVLAYTEAPFVCKGTAFFVALQGKSELLP
jgi:hypothetical protein